MLRQGSGNSGGIVVMDDRTVLHHVALGCKRMLAPRARERPFLLVDCSDMLSHFVSSREPEAAPLAIELAQLQVHRFNVLLEGVLLTEALRALCASVWPAQIMGHPHVPVQVSLVKVRVRAQAAVVQSFLDLPVDVPSLVSIYEDASAAAGVTTTWVACGLSPDGVCSLSGTATY